MEDEFCLAHLGRFLQGAKYRLAHPHPKAGTNLASPKEVEVIILCHIQVQSRVG